MQDNEEETAKQAEDEKKAAEKALCKFCVPKVIGLKGLRIG